MVEQTNNPMDEMDGSDDEFFDACEDINQSKHNFPTPYLKSCLFGRIFCDGASVS